MQVMTHLRYSVKYFMAYDTSWDYAHQKMCYIILYYLTSYNLQKAKKVQEKKKIAPGPRTRSRANAATIIEMETTHTATETAEPEETQIGTATQKAVPSKVRSKVLKPSCSKVLKQPVDNVAAGSISAYLALREKQKQGLEGPEPHEVPEANMEDAADEEIEKGMGSQI